MAGLIFLVGFIYFGFTYLFAKNVFNQYSEAYQVFNGEQLANQLAYYYEANNQSWSDVGDYLIYLQSQRRGGIQRLQLFDNKQNEIVDLNPKASSENLLTIPVKIANQKIATLKVSGNNPLGLDIVERHVLHSMTFGTLIAIILTSLVAIVVGAWLARVITRPLYSMIETMRKIKTGDLQAQLSITSKDEFGKVANTFNLMTDRLYRTEQARSHLVADVAHELRTPLTIIQGQLELIQQGVKPAEPATLLPIQDEVSRLARLVQDLHQLSLAEVGKLPLDKVPTDIAPLLAGLVEMYSLEAEDLDIELSLINHLVPSPVMVMIDPSRMTQVFVNLISNAIRYSPAGGKITIHLEQSTRYLLVSVSDTGKGIAEEHLPYIFNRFYRADNDRARKGGGTGIGLAIAKEFVESHGGNIAVSSQVGKGTTFTVEIPIHYN